MLITFAIVWPIFLKWLISYLHKNDLHHLDPPYDWIVAHFGHGNISSLLTLLIYLSGGIIALAILRAKPVTKLFLIGGYIILMTPIMIWWSLMMACAYGGCI